MTEEIKEKAAEKAMEFIKETGLLDKDTLLAMACASMFMEGFEFGFEFDGTNDELRDAISKESRRALEEKQPNILTESPLLALLLAGAHTRGAKMGFKELEKIGIDTDENGNIVGISQQEKPAETKDIVYIRKDEDGAPVGVAVQTADERFEIALKDIDNGREMTWDDAMKFKLPTKKQAAIICAYLDDINAKLKEAGGEPLDKWYWTSSEYSANSAWFYYGSTGRLFYISKYGTFSVRPVLAF